MARCFSYVRFSTVEQGKEGRDSLSRQLQAARAYAEAQSLDYQDKSFADLGISGFRSKKRDGLESLLDAIETSAIQSGDHVVIDDFSRLSRQSFEHTYDLIRRIVSTGVVLYVAHDNLTLTKNSLSDLVSIVRVALQSDLAHKESAKKSYLIRAQRTRAREKRQVVGKLPMWIKRSENALGFEFNSTTDCIRELIRVRLLGYSLQKTAKHLNEVDYKTSTGAAWSASGVRSIISNRALYGVKEYFETDADTGRMCSVSIDSASIFPALIDFETWQALQQKRKTNEGRTSVRGAYSGLLRCGACGAAMTSRTSRYKNQLRSYRKCIKATEGSCQQVEQVREPERYLDKVLRDMTYIETKAVTISRVPELQERIETLKATAEILITSGQSKRLAELYRRLGEFEDELEAELKKDSERVTAVTDFRAVMSIESVEQRNMQLKKLIDSIEFHLVSKVKTRSTWKVVITQRNQYQKTFILDQRHGFGNTEIKLVADADKLIATDAKHELCEWER